MELEKRDNILDLYNSVAQLIKEAKTKVAVTINAELAILN